MSLVIPEFVVPSDEMLLILDEADLDLKTQPVPVTEDLLERRVAIAAMYEQDDEVRYHGAVHIGRVSLVRTASGIVHLAQREAPQPTDTTFVVSEQYHAPIAYNPATPNFTRNTAVRSLFYILPQVPGRV